MAEKDFHSSLVAWIQRKGFVWGPSPEIYGGLAGFYDYAPLGKLLKNRVETVIRKTFIKNDFWEMQCPIVMPKAVWEASGHLGGFTDPLIKDIKGNVFRVDKLIAEFCHKNDMDPDNIEIEGKTVSVDEASKEEYVQIIQKYNIKSPDKKTDLVLDITDHNLMMRTTIGLDTESYNRPETATTTYLPFIRYLSFFRDKLPFGVFQIGGAFRNEISPRQHIMRQREFTQAEGQIFMFKDQKENYEPFEQIKDNKADFFDAISKKIQNISFQEAIDKKLIKSKAYAWTLHLAYQLFLNMGIPRESMRLRQHGEDEKAFYADDAWDVEIKTKSFGWVEVCGVHDRTDYDLSAHAKASKQKLVARNENTKEKETPHVLEIAFGTDRPTFALMDLFYKQDEEKKQDTFNVPIHMAPIQVAVFPLMNKEGMPELAQKIYNNLKQNDLVAIYDKSGTVGRRYARMDEVGTPFCITVDFESVKDNKVTLRDRDTTEQQRVNIDGVVSIVKEKLRNSAN